MKIQPIQIFLVIFLAWALSRVYLRAKDKSLNVGEVLFWFAIFTLASFGVIDPNFTTYIANQLGIGRGADAVVYFSIVLLFYLIFRIHVYIENLRNEITKLTRLVSLQHEQKPNPKKPK